MSVLKFKPPIPVLANHLNQMQPGKALDARQGNILKQTKMNKLLHGNGNINVDAVLYLVGLGFDLSGANLSGAYLEGAYLEGANLSWANLEWANLSGANLS
ncbi:MAG: pentapeptide repeat-containing protein, partial [Paludibacter sp.]|nr:pentapeptide repeat-containing protein [Paludibacter sp.]